MQVLTGSIIAIGLLEGKGSKSLNTKLLMKVGPGTLHPASFPDG